MVSATVIMLDNNTIKLLTKIIIQTFNICYEHCQLDWFWSK